MSKNISGVSSVGSVLTNPNTSKKLSDDTKEKLEALGIDTSNITTESEGQSVLSEAQAQEEEKKSKIAQKNNNSSTQPNTASTSEKFLRTQAKLLALNLGIKIKNEDTLKNIMEKISYALEKLKTSAAQDSSRIIQANNYQKQYETLTGAYSSLQKSHAQLNNSMSALASYNKIYLQQQSQKS